MSGAGLSRRAIASVASASGPSEAALILDGIIAIEYNPERGRVLAGSDVSSLTCQVSGHVISASGTPAFTAEDADFENHASFASSVAGQDGLRSSASHGSDLIASGASPYVAWCGKLGTGTGAPTEALFSLSSSAAVTTFLLIRDQASGFEFQLVYNGSTLDFNYVPAVDETTLIELIYNGTDIELWVNYELAASGAGAVLGAAVRRVSLGIRQDSVRWSNAEHAYFIACTEAPDAAQREALAPFWAARGVPIPPLGVLGSILKLEFDPADAVINGSDVETLTDKIASHELSAAAVGNQPAYTAEDADFNDHPSFTSDVTGTNGLRSTAAHGSDLIATSTRPYVAWLGRLPAGSGAPSEFVWSLCTAADLVRYCMFRDSASSYEIQAAVNGTTITTLNHIPTVGPHLYEMLINSSNQCELWVDYVLVATVASAALTSAVRRVSMGQRMDDARWANATHAYMIACSSSPTTVQRNALIPFWQARGAPISTSLTGALHQAGQSNALFYTAGELQRAAVTGFSAWQQTAQGSTSVAVDWQQGTALYNSLRDKIIADAGKERIAIWWIQGEQDALDETDANAYGTNMEQFADDLEADTGRSDIFWIVSLLHTSCDRDFVTEVRAGQAAFVATRPTRAVTTDPSDLALGGDSVHWTAASREAMTERTYNALRDEYGL